MYNYNTLVEQEKQVKHQERILRSARKVKHSKIKSKSSVKSETFKVIRVRAALKEKHLK